MKKTEAEFMTGNCLLCSFVSFPLMHPAAIPLSIATCSTAQIVELLNLFPLLS